jgi:hypothetical protein
MPMRRHIVVSLLFTLTVCAALAQRERIVPDSQEWRELFDPPFSQPQEIPSTSPLRKELFELLRTPIAQLAKRPVRFEGSLRAYKNWALFTGSTVDEHGASVTFPRSTTVIRSHYGFARALAGG